MATPKELRRGDDSRKNWREINELTRLNKALTWKLDDALRRIVKLEGAGNLWQAGGGSGAVRRLRVDAIFNDHMECEGVLVAKPWRLRQTPFHNTAHAFIDERGRTYTAFYTYTNSLLRRVVVNGVEPGEFQVVIPRFKPAFDYIFAAQVEGGTGVNVNATDVSWIDLNADGRAWARER